MMKKVLRAGIITVMVFLLGVTGVYGFFSDSLVVTNPIALGDVNIGLKEYARRGSTEVLYRNPTVVLPGEHVSKIPRITNYAKPCWVRARISYSGMQGMPEQLGDEILYGVPEEWIKRGDYYYFTKILKRKESADLFHEIRIPNDWNGDYSGKEFCVIIQAEAIQADNFTPDFAEVSPWGNQKIQCCIHKEDGNAVCRGERMELSVEFNGKVHRLISFPENFFVNFGTVMPGDRLEDSIKISNTTGKDAELLFRTAVKGQNKEELEVLRGIRLTISMKGKVLYTGSLDSPELERNHSLGCYKPQEQGNMDFILEVPAEWDNLYALRSAKVQWIFSVQEKDESVSGPPHDNESGPPERGMRPRRPAKTADESDLDKMLWLLACSGVFMLSGLTCMICRKGGEQK